MRQITRKGQNSEDTITMFLKRYTPNPDAVRGMEEDPEGEWVRYEVMEHVVHVLEEELLELRRKETGEKDDKEVQL